MTDERSSSASGAIEDRLYWTLSEYIDSSKRMRREDIDYIRVDLARALFKLLGATIVPAGDYESPDEIRISGTAEFVEEGALELSSSEAADYVGVSLGTIRRWADTGKLPHKRTPGGVRKFSKNDLDRAVEDMRRAKQ